MKLISHKLSGELASLISIWIYFDYMFQVVVKQKLEIILQTYAFISFFEYYWYRRKNFAIFHTDCRADDSCEDDYDTGTGASGTSGMPKFCIQI